MDIEFAFVVQGEDVYSPVELAMTLQTDEESLMEDALADLPLFEDKLSARFLREHRVLPLADTSDGLAMTDPLDSYAADAMRLLYGFTL
jgi:general secretion pathway protein E